MTFDFDEIKKLACGIERTNVNEEGALELLRFTEAEAEYYGRRTDGKPTASAGVRLEFETDALTLSLVCDIYQGSSRNFFAFDVFSDNKLLKSAGMRDAEFPVRDFKIETELPSGNKTVKIVFPWSVSPKIKKFGFSGSTYAKPVTKKHKMIIYGDSITQGYDCTHPSASYASRMADFLCADAVNKAIGGEFFCPEIAGMDGGVVPDIVTVAYGTNDWNKKSNEDFKRDCKGFLETLSKRFVGAKMFVLAPIWRADFEDYRPFGAFSEAREFIMKTAEGLPNATAIDCFDFVPHDRKYFSDAYLHPNDEGFGFYADALIEKIKEII